MKHTFIVTVHCHKLGKFSSARLIREAVASYGLRIRVTVKPVKPWGGNVKPAKVTIRRLKSGRWRLYISGRTLGPFNFATAKEARQYLMDRHPNLKNSVTVRR